jgi:hypothetical protein
MLMIFAGGCILKSRQKVLTDVVAVTLIYCLVPTETRILEMVFHF